MTKSIKIKNIKIGEGIPKVCVPITGTNLEDIIAQTEGIVAKGPDLVEWRADFFDEVMHFEAVEQALCEIVERLAGIPLIFTFRTRAEGGEKEIDIVKYIDLNMQVAATRLVDLVDLELLTCGEGIDEVIEEVSYSGSRTIASYHNFNETPEEKVIVDIMQKMADANADILKVAVMPETDTDVDTLIDAAIKMLRKTDKPLVTLSMGGIGVRTRISAESFGSAITFASVIKASAPGQVEFDELKKNLQEVHRNLQQ
jgi:3-dehydroquinate dehydratase, type I